MHYPYRTLLGAKAFKTKYENLNRDAKILDAGAGTGLAAQEVNAKINVIYSYELN